MKIKVLDRAVMGTDLSFEKLNLLGDVTVFEGTAGEELMQRVADANVLILNKVRITREIIMGAKELKLICVFATGYDNIDIEAAAEYGVTVCNVPAYSTESVMLCTVANVLYLYTHLAEYTDYVADGNYTESGKANSLEPVFHELSGKTWGIVGFGNIGRSVARVAEALGATVVVNKVTPINDYTCVDIDTLCEISDIITVHCPLNQVTHELINEERIEKMKDGVIIVNEARGAVLDEKSIANAVKSGKIGGFGSDVYSEEPMSRNHPYYTIKNMKNVCLTPHCAWAAYESRQRCLDIICDNIRCFINGTPQNKVN